MNLTLAGLALLAALPVAALADPAPLPLESDLRVLSAEVSKLRAEVRDLRKIVGSGQLDTQAVIATTVDKAIQVRLNQSYPFLGGAPAAAGATYKLSETAPSAVAKPQAATEPVGVVAPSAGITAGEAGPYTLLATFYSKEGASQCLERLAKQNIQGIRLKGLDGMEVVYVGPYDTFAEAKVDEVKFAEAAPGSPVRIKDRTGAVRN